MNDISGSCMCGKVKYKTHGKLREIVGCHCNECRKFSGHYTAATSVLPENLVIDDNASLKWYRAFPSAQMGFCRNCGSSLFFKPDSGDRVSIFAGSIDGENGLCLASHIYLDEKGGYYELNDDTEKFKITGAKLTLD